MKIRIAYSALAIALLPAIAGCQPAAQRVQAPANPAPVAAAPATSTTSADAPMAAAPRPNAGPVGASTVAAPAVSPAPAAAKGALPVVVVHKSPTCGCCHLWVDHMREAGFTVDVRDTDDLNTVKERVGIPLGKGSCHTAEVAGYFIEGHVPAGDVKRLLATRPEAKGLVLPGMPAGSPGMELPDGRVDAYTVELVGDDGQTRAFASHP